MGKKNRRSKATGTEADGSGFSKSQRKELQDLIKQLLEKCVRPSESNDWEEFLSLHGIVQRIRKIQEGHTLPSLSREEHLDELTSWLRENGVDTSAVKVCKFEGTGFGLQATRDLKAQELFLKIPRKVMMSTESAKASLLGSLIQSDRLLQTMPNVALALHLLWERTAEESIWKPYINTLPDSFNTPLYFTPEEIQLLKGSPVMGEVLKQFKNITRQYAYLYKLFQVVVPTPGETQKFLFKDQFMYDDYRWAVSAVMTRQNQIPSSDGQSMINALIPLWDMCNHCNGEFSTDFSTEQDCSECYALQNFKNGQQVFIFYGPRTNAQLLVHSGFVYPDNVHDTLEIKLGISKQDPLCTLKSNVLQKLGIPVSGVFPLHCSEQPVDDKLTAFLRVSCMNEEVLKECSDETVAKKLTSEDIFNPEVDKKSWQFLETRCTLLQRAYSTSIQEDESLLKSAITDNARLPIQLRICEKNILNSTVSYCQSKKSLMTNGG